MRKFRDGIWWAREDLVEKRASGSILVTGGKVWTDAAAGYRWLECRPPGLKFDEAQRTVTAYAAAWTQDNYGDRIQKGAFAESIGAKFNAPVALGDAPIIRVLWQHDPNTPIGVLQAITEDDYGLLIRAYILDTAAGQDVLKLLAGKAVDRMSIGFRVLETGDSPDGPENRFITKMDLWEVSFVTFPANISAKVLGVKSRHGHLEYKSSDLTLELRDTDALPLEPPVVRAGTINAEEGDDVKIEQKAGKKFSRGTKAGLMGIAASLMQAAAGLTELLASGEPDDEDGADDEKGGIAGTPADPVRRKNPANCKSDATDEKDACPACGGTGKATPKKAEEPPPAPESSDVEVKASAAKLETVLASLVGRLGQ